MNLGNFKTVVAFRAKSGDEVLRSHLAKAGAYATYMSYRSQRDGLGSYEDPREDTAGSSGSRWVVHVRGVSR